MQFETLILDVQDRIAHLTLNRPEGANAVNLQMARELFYAMMQCDDDPSIRSVLISAAGPMFSGGGDLKSFAEQGANLAHYLKETTNYVNAAISTLMRMNPPVVAAVHGSAAGVGFSLVCACDMTIVAESAKFTMAYTRAGLTPDGGITYTLTRLVGRKRTLEMALTNRLLSAKEALDWGIVTRVVPDKDVIGEAKALARELARGPTKAYGTVKRLLQSALTESLESQMKEEGRFISEMSGETDGREGITAFLEKRVPNFKGI